MPRPSASRYQQRRRICAATASTPMAKCCPAFHLERSDLLLKITYSRISFRAKRGILLQTQVCSLFLSRFQCPWPEPFMDFPIRMPYQKPCSVFVLFRKERDPSSVSTSRKRAVSRSVFSTKGTGRREPGEPH